MPSQSKPQKRADKPFPKMTVAELRKATAELDREFVGDTFGPPTPRQRAQIERAKRKRGRPKVGMGSKTISVTVEARLLAKTDRLAKKLQVPRAVLIARGLEAIVGEEAAIR